MQVQQESSVPEQPTEVNFGRRLDEKNRLKDRLIIRHLRRRQNNFLFDFDENLDRIQIIERGNDHA